MDFKKGKKDSTIVTFRNKESLEIPISASSFQNQLIRTVMLRSKLNQRHEETEVKKKSITYTFELKASEKKLGYETLS